MISLDFKTRSQELIQLLPGSPGKLTLDPRHHVVRKLQLPTPDSIALTGLLEV